MSPDPVQHQASGFSLLWFLLRLPLLLLHIVLGAPLAVATFNRLGRSIRLGQRPLDEVMLQWWAGTLLRIYGLRLEIGGQLHPAPLFVVANHVSWLDIHVLHASGKMAFVAKAEIRRWPLAGWLAASAGTVFHARGSGSSMQRSVDAIGERLREGGRVAIFPEGGIFFGDTVHRFHARLFKVAISTETPVQPTCIRYRRQDQPATDLPARPAERFVGSLLRNLGGRPARVRVDFLPVIPILGQSRDALARAAEAQVRECYHASPMTQAETRT